ncbi:MAG: GH32 C-terminal domain-containing protein, partial [Anaerolineae bacterium]
AHFHCVATTIGDANRQLQAAGVAGDALELIADFRLADGDQVGVRVRMGKDEETVIGYDAAAQELFVDRTRSGAVDFSPHFPGRHASALAADEGRVRLHVLVDRCSVEVFGGSGHAVLTDLIFPAPTSLGVEVFGTGRPPFIERLEVWQLKTK